MRILYVTDALAVWGGIERVISEKLNYLVSHYGYEIFVLTSDQGNHPIPFPLDDRIVVKDINIRFHQQYQYCGIRRLKKHRELEKTFRNCLSSYIKDVNPDVISCIRDGFVCAILEVKGAIPTIFESHAMYRDVEFEDTTFVHKFTTHLQRKKFLKLNKIVALTQGDADDWKRVCNHVCVIPNVVHLNEREVYSTCNNKRCLFAGRFDYQKNFGAMIRIWELVQAQYPNWILDVYGNGKYKSYYEKIVSEKRLNIHIHPAVPNIFDKYLESSMLLMTSHYEQFGLVLVEAMSCGLPVVAFNCPYGPADIIHNGIDGYLVENENIEAYSNRVCQLIENEQMRQEMGQAAILSSKRYKADTIMPRWHQLFLDLAKT